MGGPTDRVDWGGFFLRYQPLAVRLAEGIVGRPEAAEDLVQDVFRSVLDRSRRGEVSFESGAHARNYFLRAVRNLAIDSLRTTRETGTGGEDGVEVQAPEVPDELAEREADEARRAAVRRSIADLRSSEAEAIRLRYLEGLTYRQMGERTRESISTLQGRVETALCKIRRKIGKEGVPS